ncbi:MAG: helix-turn-helix transcriptional regulator [Clostridia bacterium]|nr:helix-turn-helix transcriptional regulator [Clostridia bacterium]
MTVGERIQNYRKQLGLSQEELGQKLFLSRQTISLWEKDQTAPTIENLIKLKDIFGVTVDEILGFEKEQQDLEIKPYELHQHSFTKSELDEILKLVKKQFYKSFIIILSLGAFFLAILLLLSAPEGGLYFYLGILATVIVYFIKTINTYVKSWKSKYDKMCSSIYEYKIFEEYLHVSIYQNGEETRRFKCYFSDINKVFLYDKWILLEFSGQSFIIPRANLKKNTAFFNYISSPKFNYSDPMKDAYWKLGSTILFVASLLSLVIGLALVSHVSEANHLFTENTWLFFLVTPIPIASIVFGFILKAKGHKYKKNIITGIIILILLCIYGSFSFIFSNFQAHSDEPITNVEQMIGINIPPHEQINTQDWTLGTQSVSRGYVYYTSDIYFEEEAVEIFEEKIRTDDRWMFYTPNELIGITSPLTEYNDYDYILIYNVDEDTFNALPETLGNNRFINLTYDCDSNMMKIVEYDIDYTMQ